MRFEIHRDESIATLFPLIIYMTCYTSVTLYIDDENRRDIDNWYNYTTAGAVARTSDIARKMLISSIGSWQLHRSNCCERTVIRGSRQGAQENCAIR